MWWLYLLCCIKAGDAFLPISSGLPERCIIFWFHAYSIIKLFPFFATLVERFSGLGGDLFLYFPNAHQEPNILKPRSWRTSNMKFFDKSSGGWCWGIIERRRKPYPAFSFIYSARGGRGVCLEPTQSGPPTSASGEAGILGQMIAGGSFLIAFLEK